MNDIVLDILAGIGLLLVILSLVMLGIGIADYVRAWWNDRV